MPRLRNIRAEVNWKNFDQKEVILPICFRSPNVKGRNFISMLDAISKRVETVHVVHCDYMDRYNLGGDGNLALQMSQEWQQENMQHIYDRFKNVTNTYWKDIIDHPDFELRFQKLKDLYISNSPVKNTMDINVEYYTKPKIQRMLKEGEWDWGFDPSELENNSRNYLFEEYAGTALYKDILNCNYEVYWGIYIDDLDVFNRHSGCVDLRLPITLPVSNNRLGHSIASISEPITQTIAA